MLPSVSSVKVFESVSVKVTEFGWMLRRPREKDLLYLCLKSELLKSDSSSIRTLLRETVVSVCDGPYEAVFSV